VPRLKPAFEASQSSAHYGRFTLFGLVTRKVSMPTYQATVRAETANKAAQCSLLTAAAACKAAAQYAVGR